MTNSDEAELPLPKPNKSPFDSGWRGFALTILAPLPFYPIVTYGMFLYVGPGRLPYDLTYWELFVMNGLARGAGDILKWFIKRKV